MIKPRYDQLDYPRGLGLQILAEYLDDDQMLDLISRYVGLSRKQRRVILPSRVCQKKVFLHFLYKKVLAGEIKWADMKKDLKEEFGTLWFARMTLTNLKEAYWRRECEIKLETK